MNNHIFISYSTKDAKEFALKLCDELKAGPPSFDAWLDKRQLRPGMDWDDQVHKAIQTCAALVFVMSEDSVRNGSISKLEWIDALKCKKPVIPLLHENVAMPFRLGSRQYIDFSGEFDQGLAKLRIHLEWLNSPEGKLEMLKYRLEDAERELKHCIDPGMKARIEEEIQQLKCDIEELERSIVSFPPEPHPKEEPMTRTSTVNFINSLPGFAPSYYQDRFVETNLMGKFLKNEGQRMMTVIGLAGIGKTTMVCRMLNALKNGKLPDDGGPWVVDGIVCLGENSIRKVNFPNLFADLCRLLPPEKAKQLDVIYKIPQMSSADKMMELLSTFPTGQVVVLLDNFEAKLDAETLDLTDTELYEALRALLECPQHAVKIIITTRFAPHNLILLEPGRQYTLELNKGLESPYAETILREMDEEGILGLKNAPLELLGQARERTKGYPRALEALVAILKADRTTTLEDILTNTKKLLPEHVVEKLVGEAFSRLDSKAQEVMQALAIYGRTVPSTAIDYLLQPSLPGIESTSVLKRLVNMHLVRKEEKRYYLHPVDCQYALSRLSKNEQRARYLRGAGYFKEIRRPLETLNYIEDLDPQLAEIELRYAAGDFDAAAQVLLDIDFEYLLLWGHFRLMIDLHQRLQGKISNLKLQGHSAGNLGSAYRNIGEYQKAISSYDRAIKIYRKRKDRRSEAVWVGNKGNCLFELGESAHAIALFQAALDISIEQKIPREEAINFCRLGICYADIGQFAQAIDYYQKALDIYSRVENSDPSVEAITHGNLGVCFAALEENDNAIAHYRKALAIAQKSGARVTAAHNLGNIGDIYFMQNKLNEAMAEYIQSMQIADEIGYLKLQNESRDALALAYLYQGNLTEASVYVDEALKYNYPKNRPGLEVFRGLLLLRKDSDVAVVREVFETALTEVKKLLDQTAKNYYFLNTKGLALCGLALCLKNNDFTQYIQQAAEAFQEARKINNTAGHIKRLLRFFDELTKADKDGRLKSIRDEMANFLKLLNDQKKGGSSCS